MPCEPGGTQSTALQLALAAPARVPRIPASSSTAGSYQAGPKTAARQRSAASAPHTPPESPSRWCRASWLKAGAQKPAWRQAGRGGGACSSSARTHSLRGRTHAQFLPGCAQLIASHLRPRLLQPLHRSVQLPLLAPLLQLHGSGGLAASVGAGRAAAAAAPAVLLRAPVFKPLGPAQGSGLGVPLARPRAVLPLATLLNLHLPALACWACHGNAGGAAATARLDAAPQPGHRGAMQPSGTGAPGRCPHHQPCAGSPP